MRLLGVILFAGLVSVGLAESFVYSVTYLAPCQGERLACTMDGIAGSIATLAFAALAMVVFGAVMVWRPTGLALTGALAGLFVAVAILLVMALQIIVMVRDGWSFYWREYQQLLQIVAPPALVVLIQWIVFKIYCARTATATKV
jgi:hypothetical protein